ncbi:uncharacterized protein LOC129570844, partial [Sitodiplosis mosellana]|uniref:uncharacterized protein LOC129570844 n=1 Tax=Sitodiplosis mosellana TaxID=263140 RepID=UPI0024441E3C
MITRFTNRFYHFVNNSGLHGVQYLDRRYGLIDRTYWVCVMIGSVIAMTVVFVYTLNDYADDPIVINVNPIISKENSVFPAVSVCIQRYDHERRRVSTERIEQFVRKYYAEHNIKEPQDKDYYNQLIRYAYAGHSGLGNGYYACQATNSTCGMDIEALKQLLFPYCNELFYNIQFNGKRYHDCGDLFKRQIVHNA